MKPKIKIFSTNLKYLTLILKDSRTKKINANRAKIMVKGIKTL